MFIIYTRHKLFTWWFHTFYIHTRKLRRVMVHTGYLNSAHQAAAAAAVPDVSAHHAVGVRVRVCTQKSRHLSI